MNTNIILDDLGILCLSFDRGIYLAAEFINKRAENANFVSVTKLWCYKISRLQPFSDINGQHLEIHNNR